MNFHQNFEVSGEFNDEWKKLSWNQFFIRSKSGNTVPSFTARKSFFTKELKIETSYAFTPIIPHSAAEYDTIFTVINSFQDVLPQKEMD